MPWAPRLEPPQCSQLALLLALAQCHLKEGQQAALLFDAHKHCQARRKARRPRPAACASRRLGRPCGKCTSLSCNAYNSCAQHPRKHGYICIHTNSCIANTHTHKHTDQTHLDKRWSRDKRRGSAAARAIHSLAPRATPSQPPLVLHATLDRLL